MKLLFLLGSLIAGAFIAWMTVLAGIWFTLPIFLICAAIVSISLGREFRWRLAAFSVGILAVFALEASEFVRGVDEAQKQAHQGELHLKSKLKADARDPLRNPGLSGVTQDSP